MTKLLRMTCLVASVAATALTAAPAAAAPVGATTPANARARIVKPLTLTATGELYFGTIVIPAAGVTATRTIAVTDLNVRDCASASPEVTCSDPTTVPTYNVTGTNGMTVQHRQDQQLAERFERRHARVPSDRSHFGRSAELGQRRHQLHHRW